MTYDTCMYIADALLPNSIPVSVKHRWLAELEGRIQVELEGVSPDDISADEGGDMPNLSAPFPYDRLYWLYLLAMYDFADGDNARYENAAAMFNSAYQNYAKWRLNHA